MSRLTATMRLDARVQARNRLYVIGAVLAVLLGLAGRRLFPPEALPQALPAFFLLVLGGSTYIFVAGMILLERGEQTLHAIGVTPLRRGEYLGSKVVTLTGFAVVESLIVVLIATGIGDLSPLAWMTLLAGIMLMGVLYTLFGIAQVAPHHTVTDFLIPGALISVSVLQMPLFPLLGIWESPVWYVIPTMAPLVVVEAAFRPLAIWEWIYGIGYSVVSILLAYRLARSRFVRHSPGHR